MGKCKGCKYIGDYTTGLYSRNPHYCCELMWDLKEEDVKIDLNKEYDWCPKNQDEFKSLMKVLDNKYN